MKRTCSKIIKGLAVALAPDFSIETERDIHTRETLIVFKWYDVEGVDRPMVYHMRVRDADVYFKDTEKIITDVSAVYRWHMSEMCKDAEKWRAHLSDEAHRHAGDEMP
ncbi:MAG: hypothetical protein QQN63_06610 [Nitrosopumilus sp.]